MTSSADLRGKIEGLESHYRNLATKGLAGEGQRSAARNVAEAIHEMLTESLCDLRMHTEKLIEGFERADQGYAMHREPPDEIAAVVYFDAASDLREILRTSG